MKKEKYEEFVRYRNMLPVKRMKHGKYDIYISDGFCPRGDSEELSAHYKTGYGFGRGNEIYICEHFTTKMLSGETPEQRIKSCEVRAMEQLVHFKETGCLRE